jgi:hypothetical protein
MTMTETALVSWNKWGLPLRRIVAAPPDGRDRREAERAVAYWEDKIDAIGQEATIAALDLGAIDSTDWSNRFVIAIDQRVENSTLLMYGHKFAELLDLPEKVRRNLPLARQLPIRFSEMFVQGCTEAPMQMAPVRLEGEVERQGDRVEQYRAVFIPVGVKPHSLTHLAFGAFNSRVLEPALAA